MVGIRVGTAMMVKRTATFGLVLLAMGGCSRLPLGSNAYSSLPPAGIHTAETPSVADSAAPLGRDVALAPVVIPGTLLTLRANDGRRGVNPTAALEAPGRGHLLTQPVHSGDHSQAALVNRPRKLIDGDVKATGSTVASAPSERDRPVINTQDYNREVVMDRLVKGGSAAAKPICSGC